MEATTTKDPIIGQTLRRFSACGPCLTYGTVVSYTGKTVTYREDDRGAFGPGKVRRRGGYEWTGGTWEGRKPVGRNLLHTVPCPGCRDHPHTQYPYGYMD